MTSRSKPEVGPSWRVVLSAHAVPPRWHIEAQTITLPAVDARHARVLAIGVAQRAAGVPPWKPCRRLSWPHTTARACSTAPDPPAPVVDLPGQVRLPIEAAA